jgi:hypothetical protein
MTEPTRIRALALVGPVEGRRRVTQTAGFPIDPTKMLPAPDVILLIADTDPGAMLFRYTAHGEFAGDTWHPSVDDAREHAIYDYSDALGEWVDVPAGVDDAHGYAVRYAAERLNSRGDW